VVTITPKLMIGSPSTVRYSGHKVAYSRNVKPGTVRHRALALNPPAN
jgi:hypothetical protein